MEDCTAIYIKRRNLEIEESHKMLDAASKTIKERTGKGCPLIQTRMAKAAIEMRLAISLQKWLEGGTNTCAVTVNPLTNGDLEVADCNDPDKMVWIGVTPKGVVSSFTLENGEMLPSETEGP